MAALTTVKPLSFHRRLIGGENLLARMMRSGNRDVPVLSKMWAWWVLSVVIWMPNLSAACAGVSPDALSRA